MQTVVMTPEERTLLPEIVAEAAQLDLIGQAECLGWLKAKKEMYFDYLMKKKGA